MGDYTTPAEDAKKIREALKARGWNQRDVSVRARSYSMGSSIDVTIKTARPDHGEVEALARGIAERISRCESTGDILGGGNRFVNVSVSDAAEAELGAPHVAGLRAAVSEMRGTGDGNQLFPIGIDGFHVGPMHGNAGSSFAQVWGDRGTVGPGFNCETERGLLAGAAQVERELRRRARSDA